METGMTRPARYRRIAIHGDSDCAGVYRFLEECVRDREYGYSVTEVVLDHTNIGNPYLARDDQHLRNDNDNPVGQVLAAAIRDSPFRSTVEQMKLPDPELCLQTLAWMEPSVVVARREAAEHADSRLYRDSNRDTYCLKQASLLVLALCPKITSLTLIDAPRSVEDFLRRNNAGILPTVFLRNLHQVMISLKDSYGHYDYYRTDPVGLVTLFHRLPSIEKVALHGVTEVHNQDHKELWPPATANFTALSFTYCDFDSIITFSLIRMSKGLKSLHFHIGGRAHHDTACERFDADSFYFALAGHKETLVELDLIVGGLIGDDVHSNYLPANQGPAQASWFPWADPDNTDVDDTNQFDDMFMMDRAVSPRPDELYPHQIPEQSPYRSTVLGHPKQFTALKRLSISMALLVGRSIAKGEHFGGRSYEYESATAPFRLVDALPESLEYLRIRDYTKGVDKEWDDQLEQLMAEKADKLPNLKTVVAVARGAEDDDTPEEVLYHDHNGNDSSDLNGERIDQAVLLGDLEYAWVEA